MPRQDVPYGGAICRLKERIAEIWDKLGEKLHTINGVPGDGDGNVKIVSGSSAVVINNDPTQNEIEVSLDTSQLPAASVSSVNGQTGAVALDAGDIPSDGNSDVQSDIDALQTMDGALQGNINAEALARQNADATLQTNINAEALTRSSSDTNLQNQINALPTNADVAQEVQDELDNYATMVRTVNNQTIDNIKTFTNKIVGMATYGDSSNSEVITVGYYKSIFRIKRSNLSTFRGVTSIIAWQRAIGTKLEFIQVGFNGNDATAIYRFGFDTKTCEYFISHDADYVYIGIKSLSQTLSATSKQLSVIVSAGFKYTANFEAYNGTIAATPDGTLIAETS